MDNRQRMSQLQYGAGILTWALVTGLAILIILKNGERFSDQLIPLIGLAVVYVASMLAACYDGPMLTLAQRRIAHTAQLLSTFGIAWLVPFEFLPIYTIIWIGIGASLYAERILWLLLTGTLIGWYLMMRVHWESDDAIFTALLFGTFHLFALLMGRVARSAEDARDRAEFLNSELIATQHLLSEASRHSERTRIARDLHDLLGHHLTALSINLQIAERLSDGEAKDKVAESRALARLLLSDVREAVSTLREESEVDFTQSVRLLVERVPQLNIHLDIEDGLVIDEFEVAESLLRCVQEALTNTLRHSGASQSWIRLWRDADKLHLEIRDNGQRRDDLVEGNGLSGMRQRIERLQGRLRVETVDDALNLHITLPLAG